MIQFLTWLLLTIIPFVSASDQATPNDPFYFAPSNLTSYGNGQIIQSRQIPQRFILLGGAVQSVHQVQYKTRTPLGADTFSVATILIPPRPNPKAAVYSFQAFEDAVQLDCAPSWALKEGFFNFEASEIMNNLTSSIAPQLNAGRYVVIPDHEAASSSFFGGRQEGYAGLDGVRAGIEFLHLDKKTPVVLYGYSGGGHATAWMVNLQPDHAPELNIVGAAYGGTLIDALKTIEHVDIPISYAKGSVVALIAGILSSYPPVNETLWPHMDFLLQQAVIEERSTENLCQTSGVFKLAKGTVRSHIDVDISEYQPTLDMFRRETLLASYSSIPIPTPKFPRYIFHGTRDEVAPFDLVQEYVNQQKSTGANIDFVVYDGLAHVETDLAGIWGAQQWISQAFAAYQS